MNLYVSVANRDSRNPKFHSFLRRNTSDWDPAWRYPYTSFWKFCCTVQRKYQKKVKGATFPPVQEGRHFWFYIMNQKLTFHQPSRIPFSRLTLCLMLCTLTQFLANAHVHNSHNRHPHTRAGRWTALFTYFWGDTELFFCIAESIATRGTAVVLEKMEPK